MKKLTFILALFFLSNLLLAQSAHKLLRSGDGNYENQNYTKAEEDYRKAKGKDNSPKANYNLGNSVYQQEKFDEAVKHYQNTAENAKDDKTKAKAYYNMGNALLNAAQKAQSSEEGQKQLKEAIDSYKESLRLAPKDFDAKHNLSMALRKMQQQQRQNNNQNKGNKNQQSQDKNQNDKQDPNQDKQDQNQNQQSQDKNQDEKQDKDKEQEGKKDGQSINRDEAEKLLQIMNDEERKVQEKLRQRNAKRRKSDKDW